MSARADLTVLGMTCARCAAAVERALTRKLPGVEQAQVSLASERASIIYNPAQVSLEDMAQAVAKAGYTLVLPVAGEDLASQWRHEEELKAREYARQKRVFFLGFFCTLPLLLLSMGRDLGWLPAFVHSAYLNWLFWLLATPVQFITGLAYYKGAWRGLLNRQPNMDLLVALGSSVAYGYSAIMVLTGAAGHVYFETAALIITFIKLGKLLEMRARGRASAALSKLMALAPPIAVMVDANGAEREVPVSALLVGQTFVLRPGSLVPVDGRIVEGRSSLNEALLTGESMPKGKGVGDMVYAATMNIDGRLLVEATQVGRHTALSRIIEMVRQAQMSKAPVERLADSVSAVFVPIILGVALITFMVWWLFAGSPQEGLLRLVAVLVVACPCALGLATPAAIMVGMGRAANEGILFRNSQVLEKMADIAAVALDKTGTITLGQPKLTYYNPALLALAASLEAGSEHPLAQALKEEARLKGVEPLPIDDFRATPGYGVEGLYQGVPLYLGAPDWPGRGELAPALRELALSLGAQGQTVTVLWRGNEALGVFALSDQPKEDAAAAIARLKQMGLKTIMISGDNEAAARFIANLVGIEEVHAHTLPADKAKLVERLNRAAFVGDGINDAPALARAYVGIALGSGADAAKEAGEVTISGGGLSLVPKAISLGRAIMRVIKQNLFWAFFYNLALVPLAAGVFYGFSALPEAIRALHPALAAAAMACSSLTVLFNSLRLKWALK